MAIDRGDDADLPRRPAGPEGVGGHQTPADSASRGKPEQPEPRDAVPPPDNGNGSTETGAGDFRQQQLAEHARYRGVVDAHYQAAAHGAWVKTVPELWAAWEEHKRRYPERTEVTAQTQPDGSWVAGGHRRLTPEQHAEASKCSADLRDEADRVILPAMKRVEAADPERRLAGLEHMLKGEDRLKEKIADALRARSELSVSQALSIVPDPVRFTLTYPSERYAAGVQADVERLKTEGFELIKLKNLWDADQYKGVNSQWRTPDTGTRLEMQFHTPESLEAKELTHEAYERIRSGATSAVERHELEEFQRKANDVIATPPGTADIENFPGA